MNSNQVGYLIALTAGLISFFSACVLPLIPGYISFVTGVSLADLQKEKVKSPFKILLPTGLFILGFSLVFALLGASASWIGSLLIQYKYLMVKLSGIIILLLGLFLAGVTKIPQLYRQRRFNLSGLPGGPLGAFPLGMAFAFAWTPCIGPILGSILLYASTTGTVTKGIVLLLFYSLGLGIPFLVTALAFNYLLATFEWVKRRYWLINTISAVFLILMGIMLLTNLWTYFTAWVNRVL